MRFDMENLNPGTWFDLPDEGRICIKNLSLEDSDEIRVKTVKKTVEYKNGSRYEAENIDEKKASDMTWDKMIVDWEKIYDAKGDEVKCTRENKIKLLRGSPSFATCVMDCFKKLNIAVDAETEAETKN